MGVASPEAFDEEFRLAYEARDVERIVALYADDAVYVQPGQDGPVIGREAIAAVMRATFEFLSDIRLEFHEPELFVVDGDSAWCHGSSTTSFSLPDGSRHSAASRSTTVLHRGVDGCWRLVLDHAS